MVPATRCEQATTHTPSGENNNNVVFLLSLKTINFLIHAIFLGFLPTSPVVVYHNEVKRYHRNKKYFKRTQYDTTKDVIQHEDRELLRIRHILLRNRRSISIIM
jgi:hypothetical protein